MTVPNGGTDRTAPWQRQLRRPDRAPGGRAAIRSDHRRPSQVPVTSSVRRGGTGRAAAPGRPGADRTVTTTAWAGTIGPSNSRGRNRGFRAEVRVLSPIGRRPGQPSASDCQRIRPPPACPAGPVRAGPGGQTCHSGGPRRARTAHRPARRWPARPDRDGAARRRARPDRPGHPPGTVGARGRPGRGRADDPMGPARTLCPTPGAAGPARPGAGPPGPRQCSERRRAAAGSPTPIGRHAMWPGGTAR